MFTEQGYRTAARVRKSVNACLECGRRNMMPLKNGTNNTVTISKPKSHKADYQILLWPQKC